MLQSLKGGLQLYLVTGPIIQGRRFRLAGGGRLPRIPLEWYADGSSRQSRPGVVRDVTRSKSPTLVNSDALFGYARALARSKTSVAIGGLPRGLQ
jgi:hypothetical protein